MRDFFYFYGMKRLILSVALFCLCAVSAFGAEADSLVQKNTPPAKVESPAPTPPKEESKPGGLLDALYPVDPVESIAAGHFQGGATLSLIQANTEDDALNVILGDVYEHRAFAPAVSDAECIANGIGKVIDAVYEK